MKFRIKILKMTIKRCKTNLFHRCMVLAALLLLLVGSGCNRNNFSPSFFVTNSSPQSSEANQTGQSSAESSLTERELQRKETEEAINRGPNVNYEVGVGYADESEKVMGWLSVNEDLKVDLLDIGFTIPARVGEGDEAIGSLYACSSHNLPFWRRTNALPYGLSRFCPTLSFPSGKSGAADLGK